MKCRIYRLARAKTTGTTALLGVFVALSSCATVAPGPANPVVLITAEQFKTAIAGFSSVDDAMAYSRKFGGAGGTPNGPIITILKPDLTAGPVCRPAEIEIEWKVARDDAQIDLGSFRVSSSIGPFSVDLTKNIRQRLAEAHGAKFDASGLRFPATMDAIPNSINKAKITLRIADTKGNWTEREFVIAFRSC